MKQQSEQSKSRAGFGVDLVAALVFFGIFTAISFVLDTHSSSFGLCDAAFLVGVAGAVLYLVIVKLHPQFSLGRKLSDS